MADMPTNSGIELDAKRPQNLLKQLIAAVDKTPVVSVKVDRTPEVSDATVVKAAKEVSHASSDPAHKHGIHIQKVIAAVHDYLLAHSVERKNVDVEVEKWLAGFRSHEDAKNK